MTVDHEPRPLLTVEDVRICRLEQQIADAEARLDQIHDEIDSVWSAAMDFREYLIAHPPPFFMPYPANPDAERALALGREEEELRPEIAHLKCLLEKYKSEQIAAIQSVSGGRND